MLIGYIRVSTNDQNTELQRNALISAKCDLIFEDKISGKSTDRPGLKKAMRHLSTGDSLEARSPWPQRQTPHYVG
ncbi:DNA-invertase hin [Yersinia nurmii]|uniref:DNA-invertase hin n=1 Tax=Yersinia nurmii TaxID=685706 RepID=A0ABP1Y732_9GAMM|nr:DNA-invertase hin [Yersinia nurmii]